LGSFFFDSVPEEFPLLSGQQLPRSDSEPLDFPPPMVIADDCPQDTVLAMVAQDPSALEYASAKWQCDREVVLVAVKADGVSLQFASPELQGDREIVLAALKSNAGAIEFASPELRSDAWVAMAARHSSETSASHSAVRSGRATSSEEASRFPSSLTLPASFDQPADDSAALDAHRLGP
jgi:hypothetical protein